MKLAIVGPVPPTRSGIADFVAELLPALAARCELTLLVDGVVPGDWLDRSGARSLDLAHPRASDVLDHADVVLVQMGNDPVHERAYELLLDRAARGRPVVCELHEVVLAHFAAALWLGRGRDERYCEEARLGHGDSGERIAREEVLRHGLPLWDLDPWRLPMSGRLIRAVAGLIVHSRFARRKVWATRPEVPVAVIPLATLAPGRLRSRSDARRRLGIPERCFVLTSTGFAVPSKRIDATLDALADWTDRDWMFRVAGEAPIEDALRRKAADLGILDRVVFTGYLAAASLDDEMAATDLLINLREPTLGETSASVARVVAGAIPVVVSDIGWYAEIADDAVFKVPTGPATVPALRALFRELRDDAPRRRLTGDRGADLARREWSLDRVADRYLAELPRLAKGPMPSQRLEAQLALGLASLGAFDIAPGLARQLAQACDFALGPRPTL